ncbi:MAG: glutamate-5-semialdehyde dehydrogenase [Acutalibacteraceae bacterium]|nr:glutamate-5-semialdehyde dehydrogenase [Acutalibacteraceae bacterium]
MDYIIGLGKNAKVAQVTLADASTALKNKALTAISEALLENKDDIIKANSLDLANGKANGMSESLLDRLALTEARIKDIANSVLEIVALPDPVGVVKSGSTRPNGLNIEKVAVPMGTIAVIYEARPNVTIDAAALCLKSGNAVILRGGKEAINSNIATANIMRQAIESVGLDKNCIQLVEDTSRETANALMKLNGYIDVLIPRGGAGLINSVVQNATVPVIETGVGNCHIYVDKTADINMAVDIIYNAKTSRPSVCNAAESLVIHKDIAAQALPAIKAKLDEKNVELCGDEYAGNIIDITLATDEDWGKEYLDYKMSIKTVDNVEEAIAHINTYSTGHSEAIITNDYNSAQKFTKLVNSSAVYVNASTRFTDGGQFGFGAEIGISTQKLHARGPIGLPELTTTKFVIRGNGQVR